MDVFRGLLHDAGSPDAATHRELRKRPDGWVVGPWVVGDGRLTAVPGDVEVNVLVSSGAGGIAALARRSAGLRLVGVENVLRDLDDLSGSAARVVAAAAELPDGVEVYVGLPWGHGLVAAVAAVEAAGLLGRVDLAGPHVGELLSVLVEADLPFKATGLDPEPYGPRGLLPLLMAVEALVDGAGADEADALLAGVPDARAVAALGAWDEATRSRVRHRLRGVDCVDVASTLDQLITAGVLSSTNAH